MSVTNLSNAPIEFTIGGKQWKIRKLSVLDLFSEFEKEVKEEYVKNINELVKALPSQDRASFLSSAIKEMPSGKRLEELAQERMNTVQGGVRMFVAVLGKCQPVSTEDAMSLAMDPENQPAIQQAMAYAVGSEALEGKDGKKA